MLIREFLLSDEIKHIEGSVDILYLELNSKRNLIS